MGAVEICVSGTCYVPDTTQFPETVTQYFGQLTLLLFVVICVSLTICSRTYTISPLSFSAFIVESEVLSKVGAFYGSQS